MSDLKALYTFLNKPVSSEMIQFLVNTTASIISINPNSNSNNNNGYPTPPNSPTNKIPPLYNFIKNLIKYSHVQTPTLMSSLIYLMKLRDLIPANSIGMETTHHRIFLGSLILSAKYLNDSSPMNKHWCKYTDGLLTLKEVNALEMEMIEYIGWDNLRFQNNELINVLSHFLEPIKSKFKSQSELKIQQKEKNLSAKLNVSKLLSLYSLDTASSNSKLESTSPSPSFSLSNQSSHSLSSSPISSTTPLFTYNPNSKSNIPSYPSTPSTIPSLSSSSSTSTVSTILSSSSSNNNLNIPLRPLRLKPQQSITNLNSGLPLLQDKENYGSKDNIPLRVVNPDDIKCIY